MNKERRAYQIAYNGTDWAYAPACYLAFEPRLGKTFTEIVALTRRQMSANVTRTLVVGPKNPLLMSWEDELAEAGYLRPSVGEGSNGYHVQLAGGSADKDTLWRANVIKDLIAGAAGECPVVLTINFEVLDLYFEPIVSIAPKVEYEFRGVRYRNDENLGSGYAQAKIARANSNSKRIVDLLLDWKPEALIVDEAHLVSTAGAHRTRALRRIGKQAAFRRLLSGTPDPRKAVSYYAQYVILDPMIFGTSKKKFIEKYFVVHEVDPNIVIGLKPSMHNEFWTKVQSIMFKVRAEDYFGPQHPNIVTRSLPWPERAGKLYATLQKDSVLAAEDLTVDGTHRLTKSLRSLQMCTGFVEDENSGEIRWIHHAKSDAIVADLAEPISSRQFVVISYTFTPAGMELRNAIARAYNDDVVALVNGQTKNSVELLRIFDVNSRADTPLRVIVLQEQVGGVGISLARARHLFFHSWSMDQAVHDQMKKRIWAPDRASNITYYQMRDVGKARSADRLARENVEDKAEMSVMKR